MPRKTKPTDDSLKRIVRQLPVPLHALDGQHAVDLAVPDSVVCFFHRSANEVNRPAEGRALHHRHVLMFALETAVTVCVDDRFIRLNPGEGLLVLPFQFHNYIQPEEDKILWLFVTFEMADGRALEPLRFRVFAISPPIRQLIQEMLRAYLTPEQEELTIVTFALLLIRIRQTDLLHRDHEISSDVPELVIKINQLAQRQGEMPSVKEMARGIGISASHLRARFKASCGVSLGRHLRRLRMEKARGLLLFSSARVSDIAEQCGFNSIFSFSRSFRTAFGVPPLTYRRTGGRSQTKGAAPGFVAKK